MTLLTVAPRWQQNKREINKTSLWTDLVDLVLFILISVNMINFPFPSTSLFLLGLDKPFINGDCMCRHRQSYAGWLVCNVYMAVYTMTGQVRVRKLRLAVSLTQRKAYGIIKWEKAWYYWPRP